MNLRKSKAPFGTVLAVAIAAILAFASMPASAGAGPIAPGVYTYTENNNFPLIDMPVYNPCTGEVVILNGMLHDLFHINVDSNGGLHLKIHDNPKNVTGTSDSGVKYQGTGVTQFGEEYHVNMGMEFTSVNNFRIIGKGPGNNFMIHNNLHVTINQDGTVTSYHDNFVSECK